MEKGRQERQRVEESIERGAEAIDTLESEGVAEGGNSFTKLR
jgi:hypothetical protein